jgi:pimeloyl-ACP methyl ester carboxylesterase
MTEMTVETIQPTIRFQLCLGPHGFHRMAYAEWRPATETGKRPVLCVHGLTRNGRDFDALARTLAADRLVLAPDVAGRGRSDWLADKADYIYPLYAGDLASLIARTGAEEIDYVGTSMGGIIGMLLACQPGTPIRRLVLNDVGTIIPVSALRRIADYVGTDPDFASLPELQAYLAFIHQNFGRLSDDQWHHLAEHSNRRLENGRYALAYDPGIAAAFKDMAMEDVNLWPFYDAIKCPTLLIRGARSDLLLAKTAEEMTQRGPKAEIYEVADTGHAPALMATDQIARVQAFLAG